MYHVSRVLTPNRERAQLRCDHNPRQLAVLRSSSAGTHLKSNCSPSQISARGPRGCRVPSESNDAKSATFVKEAAKDALCGGGDCFLPPPTKSSIPRASHSSQSSFQASRPTSPSSPHRSFLSWESEGASDRSAARYRAVPRLCGTPLLVHVSRNEGSRTNGSAQLVSKCRREVHSRRKGRFGRKGTSARAGDMKRRE